MLDATAAGYDALAEEYARRLFDELDNKPFDRAFLQRFSAIAPAGPILDVGCGPGHVGRFVHDLGRDIYGVDISQRMVARAQELNPNLKFAVGDMRALPFPNASFAGLAAFYSIIHLHDEERSGAFAEMRRVLVPDGVIALSFHVGDEVRRIEELWNIRTSLDFAFFKPQAITTALTTAGFAIVEETSRAPYDETVEAQTNRCYVLARAVAR